MSKGRLMSKFISPLNFPHLMGNLVWSLPTTLVLMVIFPQTPSSFYIEFGNGRNLGESDPSYAKWFLGNCLPMLSVDIVECHQMIYARDVCQPERCLCMFYGTAEKCKNSGTKLLNLIIRAYFLASKYMLSLSKISLHSDA